MKEQRLTEQYFPDENFESIKYVTQLWVNSQMTRINIEEVKEKRKVSLSEQGKERSQITSEQGQDENIFGPIYFSSWSYFIFPLFSIQEQESSMKLATTAAI